MVENRTDKAALISMIAIELKILEKTKVKDVWTPENEYEPYVYPDWPNDTDEVTLGSLYDGPELYKPDGDFENAAQGAIFGAFIGDALGAQIRGKKGHTYNSELNKLMELPGGGVLGFAPG